MFKQALSMEAKLKLRDFPFPTRLFMGRLLCDYQRHEQALHVTKDALVVLQSMLQFLPQMEAVQGKLLCVHSGACLRFLLSF